MIVKIYQKIKKEMKVSNISLFICFITFHYQFSFTIVVHVLKMMNLHFDVVVILNVCMHYDLLYILLRNYNLPS